MHERIGVLSMILAAAPMLTYGHRPCAGAGGAVAGRAIACGLLS